MSDKWVRQLLIKKAAAAIYEVDTKPVTGELFEQRPQYVQDIYVTMATAALDSLVVDPWYVRWCSWPGCLRSFNVLNGPKTEVDGDGWKNQTRGLQTLLCPDHAPLGHWPGRMEWEPGWTHINVSCRCGERAENLTPSNHETVRSWWNEHVKEITA